jgi:hypothetical protein
MALHVPEVPAALIGLASIGLYYLALYLFRDKLKNEYIFTIKG